MFKLNYTLEYFIFFFEKKFIKLDEMVKISSLVL